MSILPDRAISIRPVTWKNATVFSASWARAYVWVKLQPRNQPAI